MLVIVCAGLTATAGDIFPIGEVAQVHILGASVQHNIGINMAGCGDVNGDGIGDFVLGTWRTVGDLQTNIGYLIFGSHSLPADIDLATPPQGTVSISHNHLGSIQTTAIDDINGDGLSDVVFADALNSSNGIISSGRAVVLYGSKTLPDVITFEQLGAPGVIIDGYRRNGSLGYQLDSVGDVNGDGFPDILIGSPGRHQAGDEQEAFLIYGGTDIPPVLSVGDIGNHGVRMAGKNYGWDVAGAGDVNGDGLDDMLIGAYGDVDGLLGHCYLIYGATNLPPEINRYNMHQYGVDFSAEAVDDGFGGFVAGGGDVNGDGYTDMLFSAWGASPGGLQDSGRAYLVFGSPSLPQAVSLADLGEGGITINGDKFLGDFGRVLAFPGDINYDGFDDFLVSSEEQSGSEDDATIFLGGRDLPRGGPFERDELNFALIYREDAGGSFCSGAATIGDVNGDGLGDLIFGDFSYDPNGLFAGGKAYIVYGGTLYPATRSADLNNDGIVNHKDLLLFKKFWNPEKH